MSNANADLTLMPHVQARAVLSDRRLHLSVLAPVGSWIGAGQLRVLRATERDDEIDLVCGYEWYERFEKRTVPA
jgi:hypothetical protein